MQGSLPIETSQEANTAILLPQLTNSSLLSIGQLCDDDCVAIFNKHAVSIYRNAKIILSGKRNTTDGLWDITLKNSVNHPKNATINNTTLQANAIIEKNLPRTHLAQYLHACAYTAQHCLPSTEQFKMDNS